MYELSSKRTVASFEASDFVPSPGEPGLTWHNVSFDEETGHGSYLMIFEPGATSRAHRHDGPEEWYMVEGDLVDSDGFEYHAGDFISLAGGSAHESTSPSGCKIVVTHRGKFASVSPDELEGAS